MTERRKTVWVYRNDDWIEVSQYEIDPDVPFRLRKPDVPKEEDVDGEIDDD